MFGKKGGQWKRNGFDSKWNPHWVMNGKKQKLEMDSVIMGRFFGKYPTSVVLIFTSMFSF